ncbi:unnamed protein product, partial [Polarella glacialis]
PDRSSGATRGRAARGAGKGQQKSATAARPGQNQRPPGVWLDAPGSSGDGGHHGPGSAQPGNPARGSGNNKRAGFQATAVDDSDSEGEAVGGRSAEQMLADALNEPNHWSLTAQPSKAVRRHEDGTCLPCMFFFGPGGVCHFEDKCGACHHLAHARTYAPPASLRAALRKLAL